MDLHARHERRRSRACRGEPRAAKSLFTRRGRPDASRAASRRMGDHVAGAPSVDSAAPGPRGRFLRGQRASTDADGIERTNERQSAGAVCPVGPSGDREPWRRIAGTRTDASRRAILALCRYSLVVRQRASRGLRRLDVQLQRARSPAPGELLGADAEGKQRRGGRFRDSVCRWCVCGDAEAPDDRAKLDSRVPSSSVKFRVLEPEPGTRT